MNSPDKILIVRPDRLGDLILSLPVAETMKVNRPETRVDYLISPSNVSLAPLIDYVDNWLIDLGDSGRLSITGLAKKIKEGRYDCVIELKPAWRTAVAGYLSGVKLRIGTSRRLYSLFYSHRLPIHRKSSGFHQTDLELRHLQPFEPGNYVENPRVNVTIKGETDAGRLLDVAGKPYLVIHPGSHGSAPNWPLDHYRQLAQLIRGNLDYEVVITDRNPVPPGFDGCLDLGGKTDLESLAAILSRAEIFISGSTGPLHLADALGTTCLSFFLDRPDIGPERWGPRRNMDSVIIPSQSCKCGDLTKCSCLEQIPPDDAFEKIKSVLSKRKTTGVKGN